MLMRHSPSLIAIAIPTILTAAGVYIALAFATRITGKILGTEQAQTGSPEIRPVETSERPKPFVEQAPPPSPDLVAARVRQEIEANRRAARELLFPILELEAVPAAATAGEDPVPLKPLQLPSLELPNAAGLLPHGATPSNSAETQ